MKLLLFAITLCCSFPAQNFLKKTIILINGDPHLVVLDDKGYLVETIQVVPYYFSSGLSHEEIVSGLEDQLDRPNASFYASNEDRFVSMDEIDIAANSELIQFLPGKALLNRDAVNRIRSISRDYLDGGIDRINLSIIFENTRVSKLLTENRLNSVKDLLIAFGVEGDDISTKRDFRSGLDDNPFVRIAYKKRL